jgi:hypothetical protein
MTEERQPADGPDQLKQRRLAARTKELTELMERRPDLRGVHLPADLADESVRWSA